MILRQEFIGKLPVKVLYQEQVSAGDSLANLRQIAIHLVAVLRPPFPIEDFRPRLLWRLLGRPCLSRRRQQQPRRILERSRPRYLHDWPSILCAWRVRAAWYRVPRVMSAQADLQQRNAPQKSESFPISSVILITCPASVLQYSLRISPFWLKIAKNLAKN